MDSGLLRAIVSEAAARLAEQEIQRVAYLGARRYLLRFATPEHDNFLISVRPELPRAHLLGRGDGLTEAPLDRFAALADAELAGARLAGLDAVPGDRVLRLSFRVTRAAAPPAGRTLVAELFGRSANLLLLDDSGIVLGYARDLGSAHRAPAAGEPYRPPAPADPQAPAMASRDADWSVVSSTRPLDAYREGDRPGRDEIRVGDLETGTRRGDRDAAAAGQDAAARHVARFGGPSAAASAAYGLLERLRDFDDARAHHQAVVRRERARLDVLAARLATDLERARDSDRHRRWGVALLAGLGQARVNGTTAVVPDPEATGPATIAVPIDPALALPANAERHFALWKKGKRGEATIQARQTAVRRRLEAWAAVEVRAASVATAPDLEELRQAMAECGIVHAAPRAKRAPAAPRREEPTRVRRHTTADGHVVLVGRSGPENDTLTFRVASPWDFWLHAAGTPGAHVIVRNPARLKAIPEETLRAAARIAAWYSGARGDGKVEVHYTQRKHVHKRKGMPAGQVLVRRFRSILVAPGLPQAAIEDI
jgi:predicted ribosome quality control (RQC) complex YloA/Tae2 family protein